MRMQEISNPISMMTTILKCGLILVLAGAVFGQQKPAAGYAPVNGLKMYYEIRGNGEPVVMLHGAFMAISGDWKDWVDELAKRAKSSLSKCRATGGRPTSIET